MNRKWLVLFHRVRSVFFLILFWQSLCASMAIIINVCRPSAICGAGRIFRRYSDHVNCDPPHLSHMTPDQTLGLGCPTPYYNSNPSSRTLPKVPSKSNGYTACGSYSQAGSHPPTHQHTITCTRASEHACHSKSIDSLHCTRACGEASARISSKRI